MNFIALLQSLFGLLDQIGPALNQLILTAIPGEQQAEMTRRIRRCKNVCRRNRLKLSDIQTQVAADFKDQPVDLQGKLTQLIADELGVKS